MVWSLLPVVLLNFTSKIQSFQLRLFGNFVCGQKNFMHTFHIWFSWSCVITYLTLRKLHVIQTLLTIDYEPFSQWNFTSVTTIFHFGRFVTSHCGVLFPGETMRDYCLLVVIVFVFWATGLQGLFYLIFLFGEVWGSGLGSVSMIYCSQKTSCPSVPVLTNPPPPP